jgi:hypothetical protein
MPTFNAEANYLSLSKKIKDQNPDMPGLERRALTAVALSKARTLDKITYKRALLDYNLYVQNNYRNRNVRFLRFAENPEEVTKHLREHRLVYALIADKP